MHSPPLLFRSPTPPRARSRRFPPLLHSPPPPPAAARRPTFPPATPLPSGGLCTLTCNEPDRPASTQSPLAPCISRVSQSVSQSLRVSQSVGESGRSGYARARERYSSLSLRRLLYTLTFLPLPLSPVCHLSPFLFSSLSVPTHGLFSSFTSIPSSRRAPPPPSTRRCFLFSFTQTARCAVTGSRVSRCVCSSRILFPFSLFLPQ